MTYKTKLSVALAQSGLSEADQERVLASLKKQKKRTSVKPPVVVSERPIRPRCDFHADWLNLDTATRREKLRQINHDWEHQRVLRIYFCPAHPEDLHEYGFPLIEPVASWTELFRKLNGRFTFACLPHQYEGLVNERGRIPWEASDEYCCKLSDANPERGHGKIQDANFLVAADDHPLPETLTDLPRAV